MGENGKRLSGSSSSPSSSMFEGRALVNTLGGRFKGGSPTRVGGGGGGGGGVGAGGGGGGSGPRLGASTSKSDSAPPRPSSAPARSSKAPSSSPPRHNHEDGVGSGAPPGGPGAPPPPPPPPCSSSHPSCSKGEEGNNGVNHSESLVGHKRKCPDGGSNGETGVLQWGQRRKQRQNGRVESHSKPAAATTTTAAAAAQGSSANHLLGSMSNSHSHHHHNSHSHHHSHHHHHHQHQQQSRGEKADRHSPPAESNGAPEEDIPTATTTTTAAAITTTNNNSHSHANNNNNNNGNGSGSRGLHHPNQNQESLVQHPLQQHPQVQQQQQQQLPQQQLPQQQQHPPQQQQHPQQQQQAPQQQSMELDPPKGDKDKEKVNMELFEWPKFLISLSRKEKEDDFLAIKGSKLPQRPKRRSKHVEKILHYCSPGMWLSDLTRERYEVREKKSKKKPRGLKAMSLESDSD